MQCSEAATLNTWTQTWHTLFVPNIMAVLVSGYYHSQVTIIIPLLCLILITSFNLQYTIAIDDSKAESFLESLERNLQRCSTTHI